MDRPVSSSGWVPLARLTRHRYANLLSGLACDSHRSRRGAALGRSMTGWRTRCSQHSRPRHWDSAGYPTRAIDNPEYPEPRRARRHTAMADASPVRLDALLDAKLLVDCEPVLVTPKPKNRPVNQPRQLLRRHLI